MYCISEQQEAEKLAKSNVSTPEPDLSHNIPTDNPISTSWTDKLKDFLDPPSPDSSDKQLVFLTPADSDTDSDTWPTPIPPRDDSQPGDISKLLDPGESGKPTSTVVSEAGEALNSASEDNNRADFENIISATLIDTSDSIKPLKGKVTEEKDNFSISKTTSSATLSDVASQFSKDSCPERNSRNSESEKTLSQSVTNSGRSKNLLEKSNEIVKLLSSPQVK